MDEVVVCRLMALARKRWPAEYAAKPKLVVVKNVTPAPEDRQGKWTGVRPLEKYQNMAKVGPRRA